ncbi:MAG: Rrf2 family transcriptional regulator [Ileibacterium sp.]|nr:Rrf2 family transcriptional regulator [Ileibacterium sp.]
MKVSTRGRYALKMLTDLALNQQDGYLNLNEIANRQHISKKYLEQIVALLNRQHMLKASRGPQGGYRLAKAPYEYNIGEILRLTEGSVDLAPWTSIPQEDLTNYEFWDGFNKAAARYVDSMTLQDLLEAERIRIAGNSII